MFSRLRAGHRRLWIWRRASARYPRLAAMRRRLSAAAVRSAGVVGRGRTRPAGGADLEDGGLNPANILWIFCVARSGSTWLAEMMGEIGGHKVWKEPRVGHLFGEFYVNTPREKTRSANFIMGEPTRDGWIHAIRNFVLTGARHTFPFLGPENYLVVKEPGGGVGAPFLMEALPESRMILLVRDPRGRSGVLAGRHEEGQLAEVGRRLGGQEPLRRAPGGRGAQIGQEVPSQHGECPARLRSPQGPQGGGPLRRPESRHPRSHAAPVLALGIEVDPDELARAVERHAWESIPEDMKGQGKFYRKASPGGWREDLTAKQAKIVEEITAP